jgi:uncharacterized protein YjbI with pentapeptide repeats
MEWLHRLQAIRTWEEKYWWRAVFAAIVSTSLLSAVVEGLAGHALTQWVGLWLLDFSTDLAGGVVVILFLRYSLKLGMAQLGATPEIQSPPVQTYFIDASEVPAPLPTQPLAPSPQERLEGYLKALRNSSSVEGRQAILTQLKKESLSLVGQALIDLDLQLADLSAFDLSQCDLSNAKLRGANLSHANLQASNFYMAQLIEANLRRADLSQANLERAFLSGADLQGAKLRGATISTSLWRVNLSGADLRGADLRGAELFRTNLQGAWLEGVRLADTKINADTVLPDGSLWSAKSDIQRFIDPQHPLFWSPALSRVTHETE